MKVTIYEVRTEAISFQGGNDVNVIVVDPFLQRSAGFFIFNYREARREDCRS
jgi:hypothetical protein